MQEKKVSRKGREEIKSIGIATIKEEKKAIENLISRIDDSFSEAVELLYGCEGRVIVTGIGKSADIAKKMVSTFNSTGTAAIFMGAVDAIHGDLGMLQKGDVVICASKSGDTPEIKTLVPLIKSFGNKLIAIVGKRESFLAREADVVLDVTVEREATPSGLAPTCSTTAQLVMGDALAVALIECRGFSAEDFGRYHPGGALGKRLYLRVSDLYVQNGKPCVSADATIEEVVLEMSGKRLGCTVVEEDGKMVGIITDGDLRRMMQTFHSPQKASDIMNSHPKCILYNEYAVTALEKMRQMKITQLVVVDEQEQYLGIVHIHDILREGII